MTSRYLEDFAVGDRFRTADFSLGAEEIMHFARQFDPQSIHTDPEAAAKGPFGGLIASGFHTTARQFRTWIDLGFLEDTSLGGPGIDEIRWHAPVRAGDVISTEVEILEARPSRSQPDRGVLRYRITGQNQDGVRVITSENVSFVRRHPES